MLTQITKVKQIPVLDEGVTKTSDVSSINFTGAGVTATNVGNDVTVAINGISGSTQQLELFGSRPSGAVGTNTAAGLVGTFAPIAAYAVQQTGGGGATGTVYYQFIVPSNYVSNGVFRVTVRRSFTTTAGQSLTFTVYVDGVASNINAQNIFPTGNTSFETFTTAALTTAVTPGVSTITVGIAYTVTVANGLYYFKDLSLNYTS